VLAARCRRFRGATVDHPAPPASPRRARNFSREGACAQRAPRAGSRSAGGRVRLERFFAVSGWCTVPTMFSPQQKRRRTDTEPIDLSGEEPIDLRPEDGQDVIDLTGERPAARRRPLRLGRRRRGHRIDCRRCRLRTEAPAVVRRLGRGSGSGHVRFGGARRLGRRFAHRATASTASRGSVVRGQERRSGRPPRDERGVAARPASLRALRGRVAARPRQEHAIGLPRDRGEELRGHTSGRPRPAAPRRQERPDGRHGRARTLRGHRSKVTPLWSAGAGHLDEAVASTPPPRGGADRRETSAHRYFGKTVRASAFYGDRGSRKMLIFALLVDRSGVVSEDRAHKGEICVDKIDHQLPIAVVTRSTSSRTPAYWTGCRSARSARQPLEPNPV